jgi:hypothetical protein
MESGCLAVSFCVEIYTSGVVLGYGFNILCPCIWCFEVFFSFSWSSSSVPQRGVCWICCPLQGSGCGADYLFSPFSEGLEFLLFDGDIRALLQSQWRVLGLCALWVAGLLAAAE